MIWVLMYRKIRRFISGYSPLVGDITSCIYINRANNQAVPLN